MKVVCDSVRKGKNKVCRVFLGIKNIRRVIMKVKLTLLIKSDTGKVKISDPAITFPCLPTVTAYSFLDTSVV